ncbi:hypothetical protein [Hymenobacter agri]
MHGWLLGPDGPGREHRYRQSQQTAPQRGGNAPAGAAGADILVRKHAEAEVGKTIHTAGENKVEGNAEAQACHWPCPESGSGGLDTSLSFPAACQFYKKLIINNKKLLFIISTLQKASIIGQMADFEQHLGGKSRAVSVCRLFVPTEWPRHWFYLRRAGAGRFPTLAALFG